jgi:hypothetical protein
MKYNLLKEALSIPDQLAPINYSDNINKNNKTKIKLNKKTHNRTAFNK